MKKVLFVAACLVLPSVGGLAQKAGKPVEWLVYGGDQEGTKYSPLTQINKDTVGRLTLAWIGGRAKRRGRSSAPRRAFQNTPLLIDDVV
jgi:glucose dehydrogenase